MAAKPSSLSSRELRALQTIAETWVSADFWEDETIKRYRELGLVTCIADRIALTEAGQQVVSAVCLAPERTPGRLASLMVIAACFRAFLALAPYCDDALLG